MTLVFVILLLEIEDLLDPIPFCPFAPLVTMDGVTRYKYGFSYMPVFTLINTTGSNLNDE